MSFRNYTDPFFGVSEMAKCMVNGCRDLPGLPMDESSALKHTMLTQFPKYWGSPQECESIGINCTEAIGQASKSLRKRGCY